MSASTENRKFTGDGTQLGRNEFGVSFSGPVAAGAVLKTGCLVGSLLSDTANDPALLDYVANGTQRCMGFCTLAADNTGGALGARPTHVMAQTGTLVDKNAGGGNAIVAADLYKPIFGVDNQTCSKLAAEGPVIGIVTKIDKATGQPVVLVDPLIARIFSNAPSLIASAAIRTVKNVAGKNGAGACTATGAKVGDVVIGMSFAKTPTVAPGTQAGLTAFESVITIVNQIQQTGAADLSAEAFDLLLVAQS